MLGGFVRLLLPAIVGDDAVVRRLAAHDSGVEAMTASELRECPHPVVVTGGRDGAVRVWHPSTALPSRPREECRGLVIVPPGDGDRTPHSATIREDDTGPVLDPADGQMLAQLIALRGHPSTVTWPCCPANHRPSSPRIRGTRVAVWRPPNSRPAQVWQLPADRTPDSISVIGGTEPILLAALPDGRLVFLDLTTGQQPRTPLTCHDHSFSVIADPQRKPDGVLCFITATWHAPREVRLWTLTSGEVTSRDLPTQRESDVDGPSGIVAGAFGQLHRQHIAVGAGGYSRLYIWDASDGERVTDKQLEQAHRMLLADVDIGKIAGETVILSGGYTCSLALWRIASREERHLWVGSPLSFIKSLPEDRAVVAGPRGIIAFNLTPGVTAG